MILCDYLKKLSYKIINLKIFHIRWYAYLRIERLFINS